MANARIVNVSTAGLDLPAFPDPLVIFDSRTFERNDFESPALQDVIDTMGTGVPGNIQQIQALRDCKQFLSDILVNRDQPMDPARLLPTVCRALGESGTDAQLIDQAGVALNDLR